MRNIDRTIYILEGIAQEVQSAIHDLKDVESRDLNLKFYELVKRIAETSSNPNVFEWEDIKLDAQCAMSSLESIKEDLLQKYLRGKL